MDAAAEQGRQLGLVVKSITAIEKRKASKQLVKPAVQIKKLNWTALKEFLNRSLLGFVADTCLTGI